MLIAIAFRPPLRRWQRLLAQTLCTSGHDVRLVADRYRRKRSVAEAAMALQRRLFGPRRSLFDRVGSSGAEPAFRFVEIAQLDRESTDLLIALDGVRIEAPRLLEPLFAGSTGDEGLLAMVASAGAPRVELRTGSDTGASVIVAATIAIEDRHTLSRAVDQVLARVVTLILQGVRRLDAGARPVEGPMAFGASGAPLRHMARGLFQKVAGRLPCGARGPDHWRVGYRLADDNQATALARVWPTGSFAIVPDDTSRFYADPVPFAHAGRSYVFVEDYSYKTCRGVIAIIEIDAGGVPSPPRTVLEQPCHLSYPFLLRHGGEIYMLPEMSGAGRVQLFRANPFPHRWVEDHVLLDGIVAADATLIFHADRWWMFTTLSDDGGSSWDQLCLFHALDLFGPWRPHADNPVLVDAGAARPAGAMWHEDGILMRVAQDCRKGYGDGLAICRVGRIDETGYTQTVVARLSPPNGTGAAGAHTLGRDGRIEVIDLRFTSAGR